MFLLRFFELIAILVSEKYPLFHYYPSQQQWKSFVLGCTIMVQKKQLINDYFISSTFRDMQQERDVLNNRILPELREFANKSGRDISMVDLRWGISTEALDSEEGMKKVLSICMELIDECMPYYIVLIGEKYGTIPSLDALTLPAYISPVENKSITELEIMQAIRILGERYEDAEELPLVIAMRNPLPREQIDAGYLAQYVEEDPAAKERVDALRAFLETKYAKYVFRYDADWDETRCQLRLSDSFAENMIARLKKQLIQFIETHPEKPEEIQYLQDELYRKSEAKVFCGREEDVARILHFAGQFSTTAERELSTLFLQGLSGSGKSTLFAYCAELLSKNDDTITLGLFCGNGNGISNAAELLQHLIWRLENLTGHEDKKNCGGIVRSLEEGKHRMEKLLNILSGKKIIIFIDALDRLYLDSDEQSLDFLPKAGHCKYIISTADALGIKDNLLKNAAVMELAELSELDMTSMIDYHLREMKKDLSTRNKKELIRILRYRTPLYLKLVLIRLTMLSSEDFIRMDTGSGETYFAQLLRGFPDREEDLGVEILLQAGKLLNISGIEDLLFICSNIPCGCRTDDIAQITHNRLTPLDINIYLRYMSQLLSRDVDGVVRFVHSSLERGARSIRVGDQRLIHRLCDYVGTRSDADFVKTRAYFHLCMLTNKPDYFAAYMADVFHAENQKVITGESTGYPVSDRIIESMKKYCQQHEEAEVYLFVQKMLSAAARDSVDRLYKVVSAFIFSYDKLFEEFSYLQIHTLMKEMFDYCTGMIYSQKDHNWQYLRLIYVCCEQCSFRTSDYWEREHYVQLFFQYCKELYDQIKPTFVHYDILTHDMCMAYKSAAALYKKRDFCYSLSLYDRAIVLAKQYDQQRKNKRMEPIFCELEMKIEKAAAVIGKAHMNKQIGWEEEQGITNFLTGQSYDLKKLLKEAESDMVEYMAIVPNERKPLRVYTLCCEYYRYVGNFRKEEESICHMRDYAEQCYRKDGNVLSLDAVRNSWLRLAMIEDPDKPTKKRISEMENSLMYLRHSENLFRRQHIQTSEKIKMVTLKQLFEWYFDLITNSEEPSRGMQIEYCRLCGDFLSVLGDDLPTLLSADENQELLRKVQRFALVCEKGIENTFAIASKAASTEQWDTAIMAGEVGHRLTALVAEKLADMETHLSHLWKFSNLLAICYRNKRQLCGFEYYEKEIEYVAKLEYYILHEDNPVVQEKAYRYFHVLALYHFSTVKTQAWLNYVNWCLQPGLLPFDGPDAQAYKAKDEQMRQQKLLNTASQYGYYRLPGQGIDYFRLRINKSIPEDAWTIIGSFLAAHFEDIVWKDLLKRSDLLEAVTLEYVYQRGDRAKARAIIANGYDHYMELPLMYLLRKYDRKEFERLFRELKPICMTRHLKTIKKVRFDDADIQEFLNELASILKKR